MEDEEVGAVVVAESEELCDLALSLIKVDWEVLPHILDAREALKPDAPQLRPNPKGTGNVQLTNMSQGDVEAGFKQADQIIEFDWTLSLFSSHMPNPAGGLACWYQDPLGVEGPSLLRGRDQPNLGGAELRPCTSSLSTRSIATACSKGANIAILVSGARL